ncbi:conserved hypothetical protein [Desulfamplus magnetovallimortis]|uniref:Uncharacterized protein n=1 Tax=Desulfamplus magnetovallimortis TaxID=1246637 RepID=A0A1W1HI81_9BACT|nr:hypothetical protein [Desulfamplus magnetovallimortis]SLM32150.1 conserved hypothetical protein [Desulfamplus magnetovallimortis]
MDREQLVKTAQKIQPATQEALQEWQNKRELLVSELNMRMQAREDILQMTGKENIAMMLDNHSNHARYVETILAFPDAENLVETVLWVYTTYRSHGFNASYWPAQLNNWVEVMKNHLSQKTFDEIYPLYHWFIVNQAAFVNLTNESVQRSNKSLPIV